MGYTQKLFDLHDYIAHNVLGILVLDILGSNLGTQALTQVLESLLTLHTEPKGLLPLALAQALVLVRVFQLHKVTH